MLSISTSDKTVGLTDLTHATVTGNGVFDVLMKAVKAHLEQEWTAGRIKGTEYSTVYLSALQTTLQTALQFVLSQEKTNQEIELVKAQIEVQKQQVANLALEAANIPKQGQLIDAQKNVQTQQASNLAAELLNIPKQGLLIDTQKENQAQQKLNLIAEALNIPKQGLLLDAQKDKANAEKLFVDQKTVTEKASTDATVIGAGSVIDKQNAVYTAQKDGYARDAEQKAAKIMADFLSIRTTALNTTGDLTINKFSDPDIGAVITKLKSGISA